MRLTMKHKAQGKHLSNHRTQPVQTPFQPSCRRFHPGLQEWADSSIEERVFRQRIAESSLRPPQE